jgi:hypothetical protein
MGFTVTRPGGANDAEFQNYARLLRKRGLDLGKLPRVPEPGTNRRWLYVWDQQAEAQAFAKALKKDTGDGEWAVVEVNNPSSEGPLGPIVIQLVREGSGLTFALHTLSRALIRSAFPDAVAATTFATLTISAWNEFRKTKGELGDLVREIVPVLTGLTREQLESLGYAVVDTNSDQTLIFRPPAFGNHE